MTSVGGYAFYCCSGLTNINIPNSVTSIGGYAFAGCSGLASITIGSGITNIGENGFASCPELSDVYCFAESVPSTYSNAFEYSYIEYATLHVPATSIEAYKAAEPWKNFKNILEYADPSGIQGISLDMDAKTPIYDLNGRRLTEPARVSISSVARWSS